MRSESKHERYEELDALRGIAALMVVFFHFTLGDKGRNVFFKLGTTGVDLFFIISGFVIFMSINKISNARQFIINRASRLYPTYWSSVIFTFIILLCYNYVTKSNINDVSFKDFFGNMTMFQFYLHVDDLDGSYWTMIIEMLFYISILLLYHFRFIKHIDFIATIVILSTICLTQFFFQYLMIKRLLFWFPLLEFLPLFYAGTIFYRIYTRSSDKPRFSSLLILFCFASQLLLFNFAGKSKGFIEIGEYVIMLFVFFSLFFLFINQKLKFLVNRITLFLGKISFALYLTHQFFGANLLLPYLTNVLEINFWIASVLITLPMVIIVATLLTFYVEVPYSKKMKQALTKL